MEWRYQYETITDRGKLIEENKSLHLIREENITEGNFLTFSDEPLPEPVVYVNLPQEDLKALNLLRAQASALSERADFVEDVIAEIAEQVYK